MFNLEQAVQQWSELVLSADSVKNRNIDELKDHLYCEIEKHINDGSNESDAFKYAIANIGESDILATEYNKNKNFINKLCAFEYGTIGQHGQNRDKFMINRKQLQTQNAILWAAAILASAVLLRGIPQSSDVIFFVLVPLSVMSVLSMNGKLSSQSISCEIKKIKSLFSKSNN